MKKLLIIVLIVIAGAASYGYYLYNKPRSGAADMKTAYTVDAKSLFTEFSTDENTANAKYLGKAIEVSGIIRSVDVDDRGTMNVAIETDEMGAVNCQFEKKDKMPEISPGKSVTIKGVCSGYLLDVVLVDCVLENEKNS